MQIRLFHPSLNKLWKYVSYEKTLLSEAIKLKEKLCCCEKLIEERVS